MSSPPSPPYGASPPGWYVDPWSPLHQRYWSGNEWTAHVAPLPPVPPPPPSAPQYAMAPPYAMAPQYAMAPPYAGPDGTGRDPSDPMHWILPTGRSGEAIAAGYLGLVSIFIVFLGPIAIWLGILGLRRANRGQGHGRGRSIFGIVAGAWGTFWTIVILVNLLVSH